MAVQETKIKIAADNKTKGVFKRVQKDMKKTQSVTDGLMKSTSALAVAYGAFRIGAKVVDIWTEFSSAISDLSAITGASGKDLEFLTQKAKEFGASTTLSATQAAEAFKLVASAKPDLLENGEALAAVTEQAILLAEASGSTLPDAANTLGVALNQYGAGAESAGRFINVLAAGAQKGASEIADTAEAIKVAGLVAAGTGTSFEEMNAAIQVMSTVALKGSEAGTGLRNVYLNLAKQTNADFQPSVVGLTKALENLQKAQLSDIEMLDIFGKKNIVAAKALINNSDAMVTMRESLTGTNTAFEQASIKTNNLAGDVLRLESVWSGLAIETGENLDPALREIVQLLTRAAKIFETASLMAERFGSEIGLVIEAVVSLANFDFDRFERIDKLRAVIVDSYDKELAAIWENVKATQAQADASDIDTGKAQERLAKIQEQARIEGQARATALAEVAEKAFQEKQAKELEQATQELMTLEQSLLGRKERIQLDFEERAFIAEEAFQLLLITDEERRILLQDLEAQHQAVLTKIQEEGENKRFKSSMDNIRATANLFRAFSIITKKEGEKQSELQKAFAKASIIASAAAGIIRQFAEQNFYVALGTSAVIAAMAIQQLSKVGKGGSVAAPGGGGGAQAQAAPANVTPIDNQQNQRGTATINIYGAITDDMIRDVVVPAIQRDIDENDLILFNDNSRQASIVPQ